MTQYLQKNVYGYGYKWLLISLWENQIKTAALFTIFSDLFLSCSLSSVNSINVRTLPYSIINAEDDTESLLKISENEQKDELIPQVSRRGYAGEDFYQKASKSIPRMGRRGIRSGDLDKSLNLESVGKDMKNKRPYEFQDEYSAWPWHTDRVPNYIKRDAIIENCYFWPKIEKLVNDVDFCNENMLCCSAIKDSSILKRFLQTYPSKQTGTKPDYKNNQYMK